MNVVSLLASAYSGSTVLSMALGSRRQICAFGDTYFSPAHPLHRCSCGALFRECALRRQMNRRLAEYGLPDYWSTAAPLPGGGPLTERPYLYLKRRLRRHDGALNRILDATLASSAYRARFVREQDAFLAVVHDETGATHYFDGCKSPSRAQLTVACYPTAKILHLIRDPRGYLASFAKHYRQRTGRAPSGKDVETALAWWRRDNSLAAGYEQALGPGRYLRVQYADLISSPNETLRRILDFFGIEDDGADPCLFDRARLHVSGNTTNLKSTRLEQRSPGGWAKYADVLDLELIESRTRDLPFVELERAAAPRTEATAWAAK